MSKILEFWLQFLIIVGSVSFLVHSGVITDGVDSYTEYCKNVKAIESNYTPKGEIITLGNLSIYESPFSKNSTRLVIAVYDIRGSGNDNMKQIADKISVESGGFRAVLPDFFRGRYWEGEGPIDQTPEFLEFVEEVGSWENIVRYDLQNIIQTYRAQGVTDFAIFGTCYGGMVSIQSSIYMSDDFNATALVHPSLFKNDEAQFVKVPMYLMPASNDPDMMPFYRVLLEKFGRNSGHRRFDDMRHGFMSTGGNFSDPINVARVEEALSTLGKFFDSNMPLRNITEI